MVVSDWLAVNRREDALNGGLDLEMPGTPGALKDNPRLVQLVKDGVLSQEVLDEAVARMLRLIFRTHSQRKPEATFDKDAHHALARRVASECICSSKTTTKSCPCAPKV